MHNKIRLFQQPNKNITMKCIETLSAQVEIPFDIISASLIVQFP